MLNKDCFKTDELIETVHYIISMGNHMNIISHSFQRIQIIIYVSIFIRFREIYLINFLFLFLIMNGHLRNPFFSKNPLKVSTNGSNVQHVAANVANLTSSAGNLTVQDVVYTSVVLQNIARIPNVTELVCIYYLIDIS